jgi:hypothetical protein
MAARVKKRACTSTNRESDKIIVRLPEGMRDALAELATRNGRSMTAEVVAALATHFENERQSAALRAQLQAPGLEIGGSAAINKGLEDLVDRLDRKLGELSKRADTAKYLANEDASPGSKGYHRLSAGIETAIRDLVEQIFTQHPELELIKKADTEAAREAAIEADIGAAREAIEAAAAGRSPRRAPK